MSRIETSQISKPSSKSRISSLERENQFLKTEIARLKIELEKKNGHSRTCMENCDNLNSVHDGLLRFIRQDGRLRCIYGNETIRTILGYELPDLIGRTFKWFFSPHPETHRRVDLYQTKEESKSAITLETYFRSNHNTPIPVLCSIKHNNAPLPEREYLVIVVDIRVLRYTQEKTKSILHAERISTLGHLTAGIAHEISNPLSFLLLDLERQKSLYDELEQLARRISDPVPVDILQSKNYAVLQAKLSKKANNMLKEMHEIILATDDGLKRIAEVVKAVKTYGKTNFENGSKPVLCKLEEIIDVAIRLIQTKIRKSGIELVKDYNETPEFQANPGKLVQVILNFLLNSIQAIKSDKGGKIQIKTYKNGKFIVFQITDNGIGISKQNIKKIFDPYFTTKPDGTGLGLGIIKNIIHELGGDIDVDSELGESTIFTVLIPIQDQRKKKKNNRSRIIL